MLVTPLYTLMMQLPLEYCAQFGSNATIEGGGDIVEIYKITHGMERADKEKKFYHTLKTRS